VFDPSSGLEFEAQGQLGYEGKVEGTLKISNAQVETLARYSGFPIPVAGEIGGLVRLSGSVLNPVIKGESTWTNAILSKNAVRSDYSCGLR